MLVKKHLYIAGKYYDSDIPKYIQYIKERGYEITHNLTEYKGYPSYVTSNLDIEGVKKCDILIVIMDDIEYQYRGTFCELGCAIGLNKTIIIVNPYHNNMNSGSCTQICFYYHPSIKHVTSLDDALKYIEEDDKDPDLRRIIMNKKLLIIGKAGHGKDTLAEYLSEKYYCKCQSSSSFANELFIFDTLKDKYHYNTLEECYNDRINHRVEWYDLICIYNKEDASKLSKELLKYHNVYNGMRDDKEFEQSKHLFDLIIYIDANERLSNDDLTMKIDKNKAHIIITNNGTKQEFYNKIDQLLSIMKYDLIRHSSNIVNTSL